MEQMNFGRPSHNLHYPHVKTKGGVPVLGITPALHIMYKDDQLVCAATEIGEDIIARSASGIGNMKEFLEVAEDAGIFYASFEPLPSCLLFSYLVETVGNEEDFWQIVTGAQAVVLEQFYKTFGVTLSIRRALDAAMPMEQWPTGMRMTVDKLTMLIEPPTGGATQGILHFTDRAIKATICTRSGEAIEWFIRFPEYELVREYDVGISRGEYYNMMWSRLWQQVIAPVGFRCDEMGIYCVEDEVSGILPAIPSTFIPCQGNIMRAHYPDEVNTAIFDYTRCM